ncbi:hypothetical protein AYR56_09975 [Loigolactobacillus backii]|uniref:Thoeris protein ThsB TIR-like domain-containing protein n=1 Tax=Loigolactobacillus backii TaxID=375175 RepID=A0A192H2E9_9LACO|nr:MULTISPECIES: TIR domain-containing protein [Loigolactobacillus]ANK62540.1 hypothetical protein AYR53_07025 [Loigolactobacillus backii]ANK70449.1 hypothetical protein AYR56_09975 [Loigolactobacillus backii]
MSSQLLVSYDNDHDECQRYIYLLRKWGQNPNFPDVIFQEQHMAPTEKLAAVPAVNEQAVKDCSALLLLIGNQTMENAYWVGWQITAAVAYHKPVIIYKLRAAYLSPYEVYDYDVAWLAEFSYDAIRTIFLEVAKE